MKNFFNKIRENKANIFAGIIMGILTGVLLGFCQTLDNHLTTFILSFTYGNLGLSKGFTYLKKRMEK